MNRKLIMIMTLVMSLLFSVPAFAADAVVDNYQISIYAIAIHNSTDGKWYMLNNNHGAAGDRRSIDFTITAPNWLGSAKLAAGHYDQVAMVVGDDVRYRAHYGAYYTDGTQTSSANRKVFNVPGDTASNINDSFTIGNPLQPASVNVGTVDATSAAKFTGAVPTTKNVDYMWLPSSANIVGKSLLDQSISLDLSETSTSASIEVSWETTGCIQVSDADIALAGPSVAITQIRPPKIVFNFHN